MIFTLLIRGNNTRVCFLNNTCNIIYTLLYSSTKTYQNNGKNPILDFIKIKFRVYFFVGIVQLLEALQMQTNT